MRGTGTKVIVLEGGPPEWAGRVCAVSITVPDEGTLERWDHTADLAAVWEPTTEETTVTVEIERRSGNVQESRTAHVYRYRGYREDLNVG